MSTRGNCATSGSSWRGMNAFTPEANRHRKRDDCPEEDPPRELKLRPTRRRSVSDAPENPGNCVRQVANQRDAGKAREHREHIAGVAPSSPREDATEEDAEQRTVRITIDPQHDGDDAHRRVNDDDIRGD